MTDSVCAPDLTYNLHLQMTNEGLTAEASWPAHDLEAWNVAYDRWQAGTLPLP